MTFPIVIETTDTAERVVERVNRIRMTAEFNYGMNTKRPRRFDEVAIVVPKERLEDFTDFLCTFPPVHEFNTVDHDVMVRQDDPNEPSWGVQFHFLERTDGRRWIKKGQFNSHWDPCPVGWRIELMAVMDGASPIHDQALEMSGGLPVIIHVSFKCNTESSYILSRDDTQDRMVAEYQNGYGRFAYLQSQYVPDLYVKPRMNLRDVAPAREL